MEKVAAYTAAGFTYGIAHNIEILFVYYRPNPSYTYRMDRPSYPKRYRDKYGWE
jgi:hypothetical protein